MSTIQHLQLPKNPYGVVTPLRYPGGKSAISGFLSEIIDKCDSEINTYVEPYAGGAGAAIALLLNEKVESVVINDYDPAVYCFWYALKNYPDRFIEKIRTTEISIEEWLTQRDIYRKHDMRSKFNLGFSFFFLNRCNRSGIVKGGVIGGLNQTGNYKLYARFNKDSLIDKIEKIKKYADHITVSNEDGREVFLKYEDCQESLIYLDPPYVEQGKSLYLNSFNSTDHELLANYVSKKTTSNWIMTYDVADLIASEKCYGRNHIYKYTLNYSAQKKREEHEYLICSNALNGIIVDYFSKPKCV